jgi:excisionase family DNA binding protein
MERNDFISVDEAAKILGLSRWAMYSFALRREISSYKFGRSRRFSRSELRAWVESNKVEQRKDYK